MRLNTRFMAGIVLFILSLSAYAQIPDQANSDDFVQASIMIASPDYSRTQSSFGHMFMRMQCPYYNLDYCFSFESAQTISFLPILMGDYRVRLVRVATDEYMQQYADQGRLVDQYDLNLTLPEKQRLWQKLDETVELDVYPKHDYFHNGCSQELIHLLTECLDRQLVFDKANLPKAHTLTALGLQAAPPDCWIRMTSFFSSIEATDAYLPVVERMTTPVMIPTYLRQAQFIGTSSHLLRECSGTTTYFLDTYRPHRPGIPIWAWCAILLLVVVLTGIFEHVGRCAYTWSRMIDIGVAALYVLMTVSLIAVLSLSQLSTTHGFSWSLLAYNPLPMLLWCLCRKQKPIIQRLAYWIIIVMGIGYVSWTVLHDSMVAYELYIITAAMMLRCLQKAIKD